MMRFANKAVLIAAILSALALPTNAKPKIASGSSCNSDWVNNQGAMQCFIQGEEEVRAGAAHPHYVACAGGDIFCCQDDSRGAQNCVAQAQSHPPTLAQLLDAVRAAHASRAKALEANSQAPE